MRRSPVTFSITVLEGMASGLAVVTCPFEGYQALGNPGEHFVVTPFGDSKTLATTLNHLIENPELRKKLGQNARLHSLKYDWSIVADRILDTYEKILSSQSTQAKPVSKVGSQGLFSDQLKLELPA